MGEKLTSCIKKGYAFQGLYFFDSRPIYFVYLSLRSFGNVGVVHTAHFDVRDVGSRASLVTFLVLHTKLSFDTRRCAIGFSSPTRQL